MTLGVAGVLVGVGAGQVRAQGLYTIQLGYEFSGATPPAGTPIPWLTARFFDSSYVGTLPGAVALLSANQVLLSMETTNLVGTEKVSEWYFNFNTAKDPIASMSFSAVSGTGLVAATSVTTDRSNSGSGLKADGDGYFDIGFSFDTSGANKLVNATDSLYVLTWTSAITVDDFKNLSQGGDPAKTGFKTAAHVQGIGSDGSKSGWITDGGGGGGGIIPEPAFYQMAALLGLGGLGLLRLRRKK